MARAAITAPTVQANDPSAAAVEATEPVNGTPSHISLPEATDTSQFGEVASDPEANRQIARGG